MTEEEWLACADPAVMLEFLRGTATDRKSRLFACACCRRLLPLMPDKRSRTTLEVAERVADGLASEAEREGAWKARLGVPHDHTAWAVLPDAFAAADRGSVRLADAVRMQKKPLRRSEAWHSERNAQTHLLREVFGNPFRPVTLDPAWLTSDVLLLARGIYEERAFDRMPILADALQDAGCDNEDVLGHGRDTNATHVRGCWVIDLLLGRT